MANQQTCEAALKKLKKGNTKHAKDCKSIKAQQKSFELKKSKPGQKPLAAILSCADSRVIPERIFDAKEGELFVVRVAGNIANPASIASLEYAVDKLNVPMILVLGHESCGAVESAIKFAKDRLDLGYNLNQLISYIIPAINDPTIDAPECAIKKNAELAAHDLLDRSNILTCYHDKKKLLICAAYYHLSGDRAGEVEWLGVCQCP